MLFLLGLIFDLNNREEEKCYIIFPPRPIPHFWYRCDKKFYTEEIIQLFDNNEEKDAIILISGSETRFYLHSNSHVELIYSKKVDLPKSHRKGGQSSVRFSRLHDQAHENYITFIGEKVREILTKEDQPIIKSLVIVGPAEKKHDLVEELNKNVPRIMSIFKGSITSDGTEESSLKLALSYLEGLYPDEIKKIEHEIEELVTLVDERLTFGEKETKEALANSELETIYIPKNIKLEVPDCTNIILVPDFILKKYGNYLGVKWF